MMNIWSIFDLLAPLCPVCGLAATRPRGLCAGCDRDLPRLPPAGNGIPAGLDRACYACAYAHPVDHLIRQLKFAGHLPLAAPLGSLLAEAAARRDDALPTLLLPVPLHPRRERRRGFNQAAAIARETGRRLHVAVNAGSARRIRDTDAQSELDLDARRHNLQDAFAVHGPLPAHVAIVDDVVTTGSTAQAFAAVLRRHGARHIEIWAVARTL